MRDPDIRSTQFSPYRLDHMLRGVLFDSSIVARALPTHTQQSGFGARPYSGSIARTMERDWVVHCAQSYSLAIDTLEISNVRKGV